MQTTVFNAPLPCGLEGRFGDSSSRGGFLGRSERQRTARNLCLARGPFNSQGRTQQSESHGRHRTGRESVGQLRPHMVDMVGGGSH